jgi:integrase/recombinase XerD
MDDQEDHDIDDNRNKSTEIIIEESRSLDVASVSGLDAAVVTGDPKPFASAAGTGIAEACRAWLMRSPSKDTRTNYARDLSQFLAFTCISPAELHRLAEIRPEHVAGWRDSLLAQGLTNHSVRRKMTVLRSLFSYLKNYGYAGANPAHRDFVAAPAVPRDGKTVALTPEECRRLMDAPAATSPAGVRDRAILAVLAYSAVRVGELVKLRIRDYQSTSGYRVIEVQGKGGKERRVPLHPEACERLEAWIALAGIGTGPEGAIFRAGKTARGGGRDGFQAMPISKRGVQRLMRKYAVRAQVNLSATVHSLRVTALTTARERGSDIIDLQDFAGHADPRTTLTYIRSRDRLAQSPAYVLKY